MRPISMTMTMVTGALILIPAVAQARQTGNAPAAPAYAGTFYDVSPDLTQDGLAAMAGDLNTLLRFRQMSDAAVIGRGRADVGLQYGSARLDDWRGPSLGARFGVNDRVEIGAWGGVNANKRYGVVGGDVKIMLLRQDQDWPVSISLRPSVTSLAGPSGLWAGAGGIDFAISRTFAAFSPYAGVATTGTVAFERSPALELDPAVANASLSYAGLAYRWRTLVLAAEVERGTKTSYAFRIGTRF